MRKKDEFDELICFINSIPMDQDKEIDLQIKYHLLAKIENLFTGFISRSRSL